MRKILLSIFFLFVFSQYCCASEWIELTNKTYLSLEKRNENYVFYWLKHLNNKDIPRVKNKQVHYELVYFVDDCNSNSSSVLAVYSYGLTGNVLESYVSTFYNNPQYADFSPNVPGSTGEFIHKSLCDN